MLKLINKTVEEFQKQYEKANTLQDIDQNERNYLKKLDDHLVGVFSDDIFLFPYNDKTHEVKVSEGYVPNKDNGKWITNIVEEQKERVELAEFVSSLLKQDGGFQMDALDISYSAFREFVGRYLDDNEEFPEYRLYDNDFELPKGSYYEDFEDFEETYLRVNDGFVKLTLGTNEKYYQAYRSVKKLSKEGFYDLELKLKKLQNQYEMTPDRIRNINCLKFIISELKK